MELIGAAAIPETFFTVWTNVFERGRLQAGESALIHGGSSGIGTTAIQLARAFGGRVFATAGSAEKCAACERLGAERAINYREADFVAAIRDLTGGRGVDVILDMVGGEYLARNLDLLAVDGRLVQIALLGGAKAQINLGPVLQRRLTVTGSTLRARSVAEKGAIAGALRQHVWPLLESRAVAPVVHRDVSVARRGGGTPSDGVERAHREAGSDDRRLAGTDSTRSKSRTAIARRWTAKTSSSSSTPSGVPRLAHGPKRRAAEAIPVRTLLRCRVWHRLRACEVQFPPMSNVTSLEVTDTKVGTGARRPPART